MDPELAELVGQKLVADPDIEDSAAVLVLAALEGEEPLEEALTGGSSPEASGQGGSGGPPTPVGAYLTSIAVEGFRGIGPRAELPIEPGPGLTLVVGPNGCGKSSFAEGLEILLTGNNRRWDDRARVWRDGWRNLHHEDLVRVEAGLAIEEAAGETRVERSWDVGDQLSDSAATTQTIGHPRNDLSTLGWGAALENYRPFLPYNELGATLEGRPADLYDSVARVLGLDALVDARERLGQARRDRQSAFAEADSTRSRLVDSLRTLGDVRAAECITALQTDEWDLDAIDKVLRGGAADDTQSDLAVLRRLITLGIPDEAEAQKACEDLRAALSEAEVVAGTDTQRALELAELLESALRFHDDFHAELCPVCGARALDPSWRERTEGEVVSLRTDAKDAVAARGKLTQAMRSARDLIRSAPPVLADAERVGVEASELSQVWDAWRAIPEDITGADLADHIESSLPTLSSVVERVRGEAQAELDRREDAWRPVAQQLHEWLPSARQAREGWERHKQLSTAEIWLRDATDDIRAERFRPIAERATELWGHLRQGSSVDISRFALVGSRTQRRLAVDVTVDGEQAAALGVMSQGELNSLALSLFLPRATLPASPFRFIVIDDPVQSLDAAKVDGLARVLGDVAGQRQVIVFTHDDRLPEAVRRLGVPSRLLRVTRRAESVVEVRPVSDLVDVYFDDARALVHTPDLSPEVARRVVPVFCRNAIEAACIEVVRRRRIGNGVPHVEVERSLERAHTLLAKVALAVFDDPQREPEVESRITSSFGRRAWNALSTCDRGAHEGADLAELRQLIDGSATVARRIRGLQ